jgi:regulator of RNase E activity RraA
MGRHYQHRAHIIDLVSPTPEKQVFGIAATIMFLPRRDDLSGPDTPEFGEWFFSAVGDDPAGKILAMSHGGYPDASHGGGVKLSRLHKYQLAGLLTDGRLRDFSELGEYDFVTWCAGETTRWGGDVVSPAAAGVPIHVGGVRIVPGDYLFADSAGAVVIPAESVDDIIQEAHVVQAEDAAALTTIRDARP